MNANKSDVIEWTTTKKKYNKLTQDERYKESKAERTSE